MRDRDPYRDWPHSRASVIYPPDAAPSHLREHIQRHRRQASSFYGHMFVEDASRLLPWGHGLDDGFSATVTPDTTQVRELVGNALPGMFGVSATLEDGIRHHVEQMARQLVLGDAVYEVDYLTAPNAQQPAGFRIFCIYPLGSVQRIGVRHRRYVQYVPAELGGADTINGLHYRDLNQQNLVIVRLPRRRRRSLRRVLAVLAAADAQSGTPHQMVTTPRSHFDFPRFKTGLAQQVLTGTRSVGWQGRNMFDEQILPPYVVWRHLQFQRFKIELRDHIFDRLKTTVQQATTRLGTPASLEVTGLLSGADIDQAQADLTAGTRPFAELIALRA